MAVIGEQFDVGDELCGVGISIRYAEDCISLWTRTAEVCLLLLLLFVV